MSWRVIAPALALWAVTSGCSEPTQPRANWQQQSIDGAWVAETIDGRGVGNARYTVTVADGRVTGGHDGCNGWGFQWEGGRRLVVSTLIGCPPDPLREAYWAVVQPEPWSARLAEDGRLEARAAQHQARFRRDR